MTLSQHVVPGTVAAFIYQFERALYWLSKSPKGFVIGIETDDDVAIQGLDGAQILEQDKHSIQNGAKPFSDRSIDLWNTLSIWIQALVNGEFIPDNTSFLMVTNKALPEGLAKRIGKAKTSEEIADCVAELERIGKSPSETIEKHAKTVLNPISRTYLKTLIKNCELFDASEHSAGVELREKTVSELQIPEWCSSFTDSIIDELSGWIERCALDLWRRGKPAWILRDHFINQLHSILDYRKRQIKRERAENLIPVGDDLPLAFLILPLTFHRRTATTLATKTRPGAIYKALSEDREITVGLQERMESLADRTLQSLSIAFSTGLLQFDQSEGLQIYPVRKSPPINHVTDNVKIIMNTAKRVGQTFSELTIVQLSKHLGNDGLCHPSYVGGCRFC